MTTWDWYLIGILVVGTFTVLIAVVKLWEGTRRPPLYIPRYRYRSGRKTDSGR